MIRLKFLFLCLALLFFVSCASKKKLPGMDDNLEMLNMEMPLSVVQLPIKIHKTAFERSLNEQMAGTLYEDTNLDDGLEVRAEKAEDFSLFFGDQLLRYRIPLKLWVKKGLAITSVQAEGSLAMSFNTRYNINPDWSLQTSTYLEGYEWLEKPRVKVGFVDLPVQFIASQVLNSSKGFLARSIDDQVRANLDLRAEIQNAWEQLHKPFLVSEEYNTWMILEPRKLHMTPIQIQEDTLESIIVMESAPKIFIGEEPPAIPMDSVPPFAWGLEENRGFSILLQTEVPFVEAERLARENVVGETYRSGKRSVTVEDLAFYGKGNRLVVRTQLSGSYNGSVDLIGKPVYNPVSGKVELQNLDLSLKTKNVAYKSIGWAFKGLLKSRIQESIDYYLDYYIETSKETIQQNFDHMPIYPGISLSGDLADLSVQQVFVMDSAIRVWISLSGLMELDVKGLSDDAESLETAN